MMMLAHSTEVFQTRDWVFEIKYDGIRAQLKKEMINGIEAITITNRQGIDVTERFPELVVEAVFLPETFLLDGEIVIFNSKGVSDFQAVSKRTHLKDKVKIRMRSNNEPVTFMAFDILEKNGKDLTKMPYCLRKDELMKCCNLSRIRYVCYHNSTSLVEQYKKDGEEGVIWKQAYSIYEDKRSSNWLKMKFKSDKDLEVINFELNNAGKKLFLEDEVVIQCSGSQSEGVKVGDKVTVEYLGITDSGRLRQAVFKKKVKQ